MVQIVGRHLYGSDLEGAFDEIVIMNRGPEVVWCHRKIAVLHLTGERFAQGLAQALGAVDVPFVAGRKQRREERDALDVIPMRVADENVAAQTFGASRHQLLTKRMASRSTTDD